ncbi:MAG TPA: biotin transporter BioY [Bacteroidetes bacterium]|nr:biotin transporter BioY [Bacteroidota bacterium]
MQTQLKMLLLAGLMATLTGIGAVIRIPMLPVPFTLQTFFVLLSGCFLGPTWGAVSMGIYLLLGIIGLPVFAGGSGPGIVLTPGFGYLIAFPIAAYWTGKEAGIGRIREKSPHKTFSIWLNMVIASLLIFVPGIAYLWVLKNFYTGGSFPIFKAIFFGFVIFIPGLLIKSVLAAVIAVKLKDQIKIFIYG